MERRLWYLNKDQNEYVIHEWQTMIRKKSWKRISTQIFHSIKWGGKGKRIGKRDWNIFDVMQKRKIGGKKKRKILPIKNVDNTSKIIDFVKYKTILYMLSYGLGLPLCISIFKNFVQFSIWYCIKY